MCESLAIKTVGRLSLALYIGIGYIVGKQVGSGAFELQEFIKERRAERKVHGKGGV